MKWKADQAFCLVRLFVVQVKTQLLHLQEGSLCLIGGHPR
jgi:hypothetical protein